METSAQPPYCFGPFVLDPAERVLLRDGHAVNLPPKAIETLLALVEKHGHVIAKSELLQRVWPDTFVEEATLAQNIFTLRKALDSHEGCEYIETVPKRGYRFVAHVNGSKELQETGWLPGFVFHRGLSSRRSFWSFVAILLISASAAAYLWVRRFTTRPAPSGTRVMLAILPFQNLTGDPQQEFLSDGLTEELITQLGGMNPQQLAVIARTSAMHYRDTSETVAQIGQELSVDYILEGSVRREARQVRVSAQLIRVKDQMHLWARTYERDLSGILNLEDEVSRTVAREIAVQLGHQTTWRPDQVSTVNPDAYEAYLKGKYFLYKRNPEATRKAFDYFHEAVQFDSKLAIAYVGLGDCYFAGVGVPAPENYAQAEAFARKALAIDEGLAGAHSTIAYARMHDFDWSSADREFRRALELDPGHPAGYYVEFLMSQGRFEETLAVAGRMAREDPAAILAVHGMGMILFYARRYSEALSWFHRALELDPNYYWSQLRSAQTLEAMGKNRDALADFEKLGPRAQIFLTRSQALNGNLAEARRGLALVLADRAKSAELAYEIALVYLGLHQNEEALDWLKKAYDGRAYHMIYLKIDPRLDPLRSDPRFAGLLRRIGLPP